MPEDIIKTSPESTAANALQVAVFSYNHPTLGAIKVPYGALVEIPSYVTSVIGSTLGADKHHLTIWNGSGRRIRLRKIEATANITGTVQGATIMISAEAISEAPTNGTLVTPRKLSTNFENVPTGLEFRTGPTGVTVVSNYVLAIKPLHVEESVTTTGDSIILFDKYNELSSIQLDNGEGITIKQGSLAGAGAVNILAYWSLD